MHPPERSSSPLTESQERVRAFIQSFGEKNGFPPTLAEIAEGLGYRSANAAAEHVRLMAKKGVLEVTPRAARGIRLLDISPGQRPLATGESDRVSQERESLDDIRSANTTLPLIGQVAAGRPILAEENVEGRIDVAPTLFSPSAQYLLRVRGDSMIDAGILAGDLVAVHKTPDVRLGQIAVVRLDDEVTVKRWQRRGSTIVLEAANPAYAPIIVDPEKTSVAIEGLVVGLLRGARASH